MYMYGEWNLQLRVSETTGGIQIHPRGRSELWKTAFLAWPRCVFFSGKVLLSVLFFIWNFLCHLSKNVCSVVPSVSFWLLQSVYVFERSFKLLYKVKNRNFLLQEFHYCQRRLPGQNKLLEWKARNSNKGKTGPGFSNILKSKFCLKSDS